MNEATNIWLSRPQNPHSNFHSRLICFPHAGGASSFFRGWQSHLPTFEVRSVCYPGRAERIDEEQPTDLRQLASEIANAIYPLNDFPLILFGHSMGAVVALETARALEEKGVNLEHLFASGSRNGPCPSRGVYVEEDDEGLCKHLVEMGGTSSDSVNDPTFRELVFPSVRADGKMFHEYKMATNPSLICPLTTIYGDVDSHADMRPWEDLALTSFNEQVVSGGHFYLTSQPPFEIITSVPKVNHHAEMQVASL